MLGVFFLELHSFQSELLETVASVGVKECGPALVMDKQPRGGGGWVVVFVSLLQLSFDTLSLSLKLCGDGVLQ